MINTLRLENFKRHALTELRLAPLTVLVGPNGAGKTSVLEALHLLSQLYAKPFDELFRGRRSPSDLLRHATNKLPSFILNAIGKSAGQSRQLQLTVERDSVEGEDEGDWYEREDWNASAVLRSQPGNREQRAVLAGESLRKMGFGDHWPELRSAVLLRLDASRVSAPSPANERARVEYDGSGLSTVLANMKLEEEARFSRICDDLRRIVPQFRALHVAPTTAYTDGNRQAGFGLVFDMDSGSRINAAQISEGTLLTLALLTVLHSKFKPRLLLLDDIHEALHPKAQMELMRLLQGLVASQDPVQIIATTHSPYIVDYVDSEAVLVFAQTPNGSSLVRSLAQHPEYQRLKDRLTPGQLWTLDDEFDWMSKVQL